VITIAFKVSKVGLPGDYFVWDLIPEYYD